MSVGYSHTVKEVIKIVQATVDNKGLEGTVSPMQPGLVEVTLLKTPRPLSSQSLNIDSLL